MRHGRATFVFVAIGVAFVAVALISRAGSEGQGVQPSGAPGSLARFTYLAQQSSNECGLSGQGIRSMSDGDRLQGSCCTGMDRAHYRKQVRALHAYRRLSLIPRDPYDISVPLAKRLLRLRATITLSASEQATYRRAMAMSDEKGPCCCHCWRWQAFGGLARYLIHERHWLAPQLASLIGDLDGCGGSNRA